MRSTFVTLLLILHLVSCDTPGKLGLSREVDQSQWEDLRVSVAEWSKEVDLSDGKIDQFTKIIQLLNAKDGKLGTRQIFVATGKPKQVGEKDEIDELGAIGRWIIDSSVEEEPEGFFVFPPGTYVRDVDELVAAVKRNPDDTFVQHSKPSIDTSYKPENP